MAAGDAEPPRGTWWKRWWEHKRKDARLVAGALALGVVAAAGAIGYDRLAGEDAATTAEDELTPDQVNRSAERACEDFVSARLKAPSTAEFSGTRTQHQGARYVVTGAVDAENSFGAPLRSTYTCTLTSSGEQWRLESVTGLG